MCIQYKTVFAVFAAVALLWYLFSHEQENLRPSSDTRQFPPLDETTEVSDMRLF